LIAYLKSSVAQRPKTVAAAPKKRDPKAGCVTSNILHGELFVHLKGQKEARVRLRWDPGGDRERELPAGAYEVTGYRHVALGEDGVTWIWSTTSAMYRELQVQAGKTVHLDVKRKIAVHARAFTKKNKQRVALVFKAEPRLGNTIYRNGKRIDIEWQCLDVKGAVLSQGNMRYG
jgi:hypothetical protein